MRGEKNHIFSLQHPFTLLAEGLRSCVNPVESSRHQGRVLMTDEKISASLYYSSCCTSYAVSRGMTMTNALRGRRTAWAMAERVPNSAPGTPARELEINVVKVLSSREEGYYDGDGRRKPVFEACLVVVVWCAFFVGGGGQY